MKTIQEQISEWLDNENGCQCNLCERGRHFARIIQTIESLEDQEWMFWFYDGVVSTEEELGLQEYWVNENQRRIDKLEEDRDALIDQLTNERINAATKQAELLNEKHDLHKHNELLKKVANAAINYDIAVENNEKYEITHNLYLRIFSTLQDAIEESAV